jgi:hypothetical protein
MNRDRILKAAHGIARGAGAAILLSAAAFGQSADITGWLDLPWGTQKASALKALQTLRAHECDRSASCADAAGAEVLLAEKYRLDGVSYHVDLVFIPTYGLATVRMTANDERDVFQRILSQLTARYGKPGLLSEYDGDQEVTHTKWTWLKSHGKVSLDSDETKNTFSITYEARR